MNDIDKTYHIEQHFISFVHFTKVFSARPVNFAGHETVYNISSDAMCTFYGWYTDTRTGIREEIPPAQCYMDQPSDSECCGNRILTVFQFYLFLTPFAGAFYPPVVVPNATLYDMYRPSLPPPSSSDSVAISASSAISLVPTFSPSPTSVLISPSSASDSSATSQFSGRKF